jgi:penicillin-binding protein 1A
LPQAPTAYDPFAHEQAALTRRNEVLRAMRAGRSLSRARNRRLVRRPLGLHPGHRYGVLRMPNFFSYVESRLVRVYGRGETEGGGLRVYTTVDPRAQTIALNTMRGTLGRPGDPASALVSIDPHSGAIRALASSWHGHELQYDLPADGARQTGSAFKPFVSPTPTRERRGTTRRSSRTSRRPGRSRGRRGRTRTAISGPRRC